MVTVVGKVSRTKDWVSSHKIGSFSDLEADSGSEDNDASGSDAEAAFKTGKLNGSTRNGKLRAVDDDALAQDGDDDEDSGPNPAKDWDTFEDLARKSTATSKTNTRIAFLNDVLARHLKRNALAPQQLSIIMKLLIFTYPRYIDSRSRDAVLHCLTLLVTNDISPESATKGKLTESLVKWLDMEATKICGSATTAAGSTMFSLLSWAATVAALLGRTTSGEGTALELPAHWTPLLRTLAVIYNALLGGNSKTSVKRSANMLMRRLLRTLASLLDQIIAFLTSTTEIKPATAAAPFIGCSVDVALRLKPRKDRTKDHGRVVVATSKDAILKFYREQVLASRTLAEPHVLSAFHDFIGVTIAAEDLKPDSELVKAMDRSLMRSPEAAFSTLDNFFRSYIGPVILNGEALPRPGIPTELLSAKLVPAICTAAKSTNAITRSSCVCLFDTLSSSVLVGDQPDNDLAMRLVKDIGGPLQSQKTASPEHRLVLAQLLGSIVRATPALSAEVLQDIAQSLISGLSKENNESALKAVLESLSDATAALLKSDNGIMTSTATVLLKGMQDSKPNFRHAYLASVGEILWKTATSSEATSQLSSFVNTVIPGLVTALKNAASSPAISATDGWIALAVIGGPLRGCNLVSEVLSTATRSSMYLHYHPKSSFLLAERGYRRSLDQEDEIWLCRALEGVFKSKTDLTQIRADSQLQAALSAPIVHLATSSPHHDSRNAALITVLSCSSPEVATYFLDGLIQAFLQAEKARALLASANDDQPVDNKAPRFEALLGAIAKAGQASEMLLLRLLVPSHHALLGKQTMWVDALLMSKKDPSAFTAQYLEDLTTQIWQYANHASSMFRDAAYDAVSTLALVSPKLVLPMLCERATQALDASTLSFVGELELGVYRTPAGTPYVDVLKKTANAASTKGKNAAMEKWDQETRAALAAKKSSSTTPVLSKTDRALVEAQLAKESAIRGRVADALARVHQALRIVRSLAGGASLELVQIFPQITFSLIEAAKSQTCELYSEDLFQTILRWYEASASRLADVRLSLSLAVLRGVKSTIVPSDFALEDLAGLTARVLYRLRFQSEKSPFDSSTFTLAYPLLSQCIAQEGLGLSSGDTDAILEQITLTIDIFAFHAAEFSQPSYPRLRTIETLVIALKQFPSLGRQTSEALISIGTAISANATASERAALLSGLLSEESQVRQACLSALAPLDLTDLDYCNEVWIAVQDSDERNAQLAASIWEDNGLDVTEDSLPKLLAELGHNTSFVRSAAALALAEAVGQLPALTSKSVAMLSEAYKSAARERLPQHDEFGMLIEASLHQEDPWAERAAIAQALQHLAPHLAAEDVQNVFQLLIRDQALGDRSEAVRTEMLEAGIAIIDDRGKDNLQHLMDSFQAHLGQKKTSGSTEVQDRITEAVVVLLGRLARHLAGSDPRMLSVIDRLLAALHTPSEVVQDAVADCLPPLVKANREKGNSVIEQLLRETLGSSKYAERRGAAYGLAGAVKGRGISALKEFDIITRLSDAAEDKKKADGREGAMFAFETMSAKLGRLFEPYIVKIIPLLLNCLGDADTGVRQATSDAARVIMSKVSGHGVKMILPALLDALEDRQWRSKKGAIELMGNMAYLAPRQLSISLPTIIPPLTEVLTDTHAQVRSSANASLKKFGEVVDNPEIKAMQSTLLGALVDPTNKTLKALDTLLTTSFVHYIDTSSLALVVPIIERGLRERSAELKRKGAQIVGNLASLTDSRDLISYLPQLIPKVREVLVDPVPEARATAAKSLGILVERLGEDAFPTLVTDLMTTLKSDMSGVDQQGAAQGLSEVFSGLGIERMESMLPEIISCTTSPRAYVREGFISLLIYLPSVFGDRFAPYLGRIIQPILNGLADESDFVREASMRAGRMIVNNHATKAIDLLLPELERGLFDQSWRIRLSSIQLVGELLFRISGISAKAEFEEENAGDEEDTTQPSNTEAARKILETLGKDKRDRVLASIYILRQDSAGQVRLFSINVWKVLVSNTPRTVRETLPALMQIIIRLLAAPGAEQREMVARTLAEYVYASARLILTAFETESSSCRLCRKQGDRILGDIIPILQQASKGSVASRQGCCLAFAEMLDATNKTQLEGHEDSIIESVRTALVDEEPSVRQAAALAFDALQTQLGPRSIDQTIPTLLNALTAQGAASDAALSALEELMSVRAHAIFPILIPTLIASPISAFNAKALSSLVTVAGSALNRRLSQILDALQKSADIESDTDVKEELANAVRAVLASIHDNEGLHNLMLHLLGMAKDPRGAKRVGGCTLFATFCQVTEEDFSAYHVDWLRQLLSLFDDSDISVIGAAGRAMDALSKTLTKEQMEGLSVSLRRSVESMGSPGTEIAGFAVPGALKPILPILIQGLLAGTNEQREQSAFGLGDIVERTAVDALKPYVTQITGPLIRIIAERYPAPVKAAILSTLTVLLTRVPQFVRPFLPQLQRTFVKNLSDTTSSTIRNRAAVGLGVLMGLQPRIDPLITELANGAGHDEAEVRDAMVNALGAVVASGGANMGPAARDLVANLVQNAADEPGMEAYNAAVARILAAMVQHSMTHAEPLLSMILETKASHFNSICLAACVERAPQQLYTMTSPSKVVGRILKNVISDVPGVTRPAREAREMLKKVSPWSEDEEIQARLA